MILILFYYYLLIINEILVVETIKYIKFSTSCNASEYLDLENLIGSLHTYVPNYGYLIVYNMGLTNEQKNLLKRYENIEIVSSTHIHSENIEKINVNHEFILINNKLYNQYNQGKYNYIISIRKKIFLAIVIPFIEKQLNQLINQLNMNKYYKPCYNKSNSIDLIFYSNKNILEFNNILKKFNFLYQYYNNIYYINANLTEKEDRYPIGSAYMWKKLFINEQFNYISLRYHGYTHFFLMEPDTRPIRSYWLDAIIEKINPQYNYDLYISTKWWMIGSIYRGTKLIGNDFIHINGNALYHLSLDFIFFIKNVSYEYPYNSDKSMGYDLDLFLYLFKHIDIAKKHWHKFQFTDLIQNCWHTGCNDTNIEFIYNNPNTYLIHGYNIQQNTYEYTSNNIYYIIFIGVILFIIAQFRCYRRRFYCKLFKYIQ